MREFLKKLLVPIMADIILYVVHFIVVPILGKTIDIELHAISAFFLPIIIITSIGMLLFLDKLRFWLPALMVYLLLMFIYIPPSAYGRADTDPSGYHPSYRQIGIIVSFICFTLTQLFVWFLVKFFRFARKK